MFVANAAMPFEDFRWHVDSDATDFPDDSAWVRVIGPHCNTQAGKPLFVTLLLYLNEEWKRDWGAATMFLDDATEAGAFVRPKPYRAVLMEQHVQHRLSPPTPLAPCPRYSLVWKLIFWPRHIYHNMINISTSTSTQPIANNSRNNNLLKSVKSVVTLQDIHKSRSVSTGMGGQSQLQHELKGLDGNILESNLGMVNLNDVLNKSKSIGAEPVMHTNMNNTNQMSGNLKQTTIDPNI